MDLEGAFALLILPLHWRVTPSTLAASVCSICLAAVFPWFSARQGIALACLGCVAGAVWQIAAEADSRGAALRAAPPPTAPCTFLAAAVLLGVFWGGASASASNMRSVLAGAVPLPLLAWGWLAFAPSQPRLAGSGHAWLCVLAAGVAYLLAAVVGLLLG